MRVAASSDSTSSCAAIESPMRSPISRAASSVAVDDRALAPALEQDVLGGDVAVHDAGALCVRERPRDFAEHARRLEGDEVRVRML